MSGQPGDLRRVPSSHHRLASRDRSGHPRQQARSHRGHRHIAGARLPLAAAPSCTAITRFQLQIARTASPSGRQGPPVSTQSARHGGASSKAQYFPGAQPMRIKILAERGTGRLLGADTGGEGAGKRIESWPRHRGTI